MLNQEKIQKRRASTQPPFRTLFFWFVFQLEADDFRIKAQDFVSPHRCQAHSGSPPPSRQETCSRARPLHLRTAASVSHSSSYSSSRGSSSSSSRSGPRTAGTDPETRGQGRQGSWTETGHVMCWSAPQRWCRPHPLTLAHQVDSMKYVLTLSSPNCWAT